MKGMVCLMAVSLAMAISAGAGEGPSLEQGKSLFESVKLGTSGKSCASCHPGGRKLEWAATFDEERLSEIVNGCVQKALKGKPLDPASDEMKSLIRYIKSFAGPGN